MAGIVGIDLSKNRLDVCALPQDQRFTVATDADGLQTLIPRLQSLAPDLIVLEATGGYEVTLAAELTAAGLPVVVVNPRQVRDFAKALGLLAKTDAIDAFVLARFGEAVKPQCRPIPTPQEQSIKDFMARRRQLVSMRTAERNRLEHARGTDVRNSIHMVIRTLDKLIGKIDRQLDREIHDSPIWQEKNQLMQSVPGIGPTTAKVLLSNLPELGLLNRRQIASLVGVAPINCDSGTLRGKRITRGGRSDVRTALYAPTLVAIKHNPAIRDFYRRLRTSGKPGNVAVIASLRKLLTMLNAILKTGQPYRGVPA